MALEPTEEQDLAVRMALNHVWCDHTGRYNEVWNLVRDMVLEEAAKVCEATAEDYATGRCTPKWTAQAAAVRIRAMKGKP